ncbi:hypothetical protein D3C85_1435190 [compost metagenome]
MLQNTLNQLVIFVLHRLKTLRKMALINNRLDFLLMQYKFAMADPFYHLIHQLLCISTGTRTPEQYCNTHRQSPPIKC